MSFYGNITYYLSNAFKALVYDNGASGTTTVAPQTIGTTYTLIPRNRDDQTALIAYNKWIRFGGDSSMSNNNQVYIFHAVTGHADVTLTPSTALTNNGTVIDFDKDFSIPSITFDAAGHITTGTTVNFKIANPPGLGELDEIESRLDALEEGVNGPSNSNSIVRQLESLRTITQDWQVKNNSTPMTNGYKEANGIGTTLHELMVLVGTRIAGDNLKYTENGVEHQGYQVYNYSDAINDTQTILGMANSALSLVTGISRSNYSQVLGIRSLIDYLVSSGSLGSADAERLKTDYFYLGNNQI